jgi:hypothetical protein
MPFALPMIVAKRKADYINKLSAHPAHLSDENRGPLEGNPRLTWSFAGDGSFG